MKGNILRYWTAVTYSLLIFAAVACTPSAVPEVESLKDGVWIGSGEGRSGSIIASVEVKDQAVAHVVIVSQSESSFAQEAINTIVERAVGRKGLLNQQTDAVSGATLTSHGVIGAINMALMAAMGKPADAGKIYKDGRCDIVIVGAGGAGLSAAVAAAESGAGNIVVLEKQGIIGGNTNYSTGGINAAETEVQKSMGIEDSKQLFYDDTMTGGRNENLPDLVRNFVEHAAETINWLIGKGADLSDVGLMGGSSVKRTHRPKGGTAIGPHLMKILKTAAADKKIEIRTSNKVLGLLSSGSAVTGVQVENADGSIYTLQAKAVVIATGGFGANLEMVTDYQPGLSGFATLNHPGATGDAFAWVKALGGATIQMSNIQIHPTAEAMNHILITEAVRGNGAILVNREAKRFVNEMETRDVVSAAILQQSSGDAYLIFDQEVRKSLASIETYANQHLLIEGSSIAGLANAATLPPAALEATMSRYAAQQKAGVDDDFGRGAAEMPVALQMPPFYAVRVKPAIHHTMGGLSVNTETQVLKSDGTPIPGLFAAGEVTGGLHGANRLGGNGVADIVVNGKLAGEAAAKYASLP